MQFKKLNILYPKKRAIVTGAGSGLGFELTKLLAANDWQILAIDLNVEKLRSLNLPKVEISEFDITQKARFKSSLLEFCSHQDGVDVLFNNAGVGEGTLFQDYALENWDWIIEINLKSVILATHTVIPFLLKVNSGSIVNMASMAGIANLPKMSPYNVTKAGIISLSETLAHELSKTNVRVKCVMPTFFRSSVLQHSKGDKETLQAARKVVSSSKLNSQEAAIIILSNLHSKNETLRFPLSAAGFFYSRRLIPSLYKYLIRRFLVKL